MFEDYPDLLSFRQCMELLQIVKNSLLDLLHSHELEGIMIKGRWRIPKNHVIQFLFRR